MTPAAIIALINTYIVSNGAGQITGPILNNILVSIVNLFTTVTAAPARIVSSSGALTVLISDQFIALQRTFSLAPTTILLPTGAVIGQSFTIEDVVGNLSAYPATVTPPSGQTIAGRANYIMNEDFQSATFRYYGSNVWSTDT